MSIKDIVKRYGATHYSVMADGVTPQMYYKQEPVHDWDKTSKRVWVYLSFTGMWKSSAYALNPEAASNLVKIHTEVEDASE